MFFGRHSVEVLLLTYLMCRSETWPSKVEWEIMSDITRFTLTEVRKWLPSGMSSHSWWS